jgi:cell fate (sporulation/competence/biofilm development) regulator YmcA (YheA/YmcA/DUF963 family)
MAKVTCFLTMEQSIQDNSKKEKLQVMVRILIKKINNLKEYGKMEN